MADVIIGGVSRHDPPHTTPKDKPIKEVLVGCDCITTKWQITWMDSPLEEDNGAKTIGKCLSKKHNVKFFLGELSTIINIPDDETSHQSEGMDEEATELPR